VSVHGEYSRTLEALLALLRELNHPEAQAWARQLEAARVSAHPDLSSATRACLGVLTAIGNDEGALALEGLRNPRDRLEAHCRAILGV
jgi:hypothetical protein